jgi:hypothetical protein
MSSIIYGILQKFSLYKIWHIIILSNNVVSQTIIKLLADNYYKTPGNFTLLIFTTPSHSSLLAEVFLPEHSNVWFPPAGVCPVCTRSERHSVWLQALHQICSRHTLHVHAHQPLVSNILIVPSHLVYNYRSPHILWHLFLYS